MYYCMEALMAAAAQMGFAPAEAELLVSQTFRGAVELYSQAGLELPGLDSPRGLQGRHHRGGPGRFRPRCRARGPHGRGRSRPRPRRGARPEVGGRAAWRFRCLA
ncbi:MAG: pyrroline-5-carboxylate reductase dimerization domain-containing protein [Hymenobacter sp.]